MLKLVMSVLVSVVLATLILALFASYSGILSQMLNSYSFTKKFSKRSKINGLSSMDEFLNLPPDLKYKPNSKSLIFVYSQKRDFETLQDPSHICKAYINTTKSYINTDIFLLLVVRSACNNFKSRNLIRKTWGNETWLKDKTLTTVKIVFVIGNCRKGPENVILNEELSHYNDLLQFDVDEELRNLTRKDLLFMQWFLKNCRNVPFVYKGDDDVFLNVKSIVLFLQELSVEKAKNLALGFVMRSQKRVHNILSKYYMPYNLYPHEYYPKYLSGTGQVYSSLVIERLFNASLFLKIHPIDDAFGGSLMEAAGVQPMHDIRFKMWGFKSHYTMCNVEKQFLIYFREKSLFELWKFWKDFNRYDYSHCNEVLKNKLLITEFLKLV